MENQSIKIIKRRNRTASSKVHDPMWLQVFKKGTAIDPL